ncbi:MAG: RICIN domain-containing protein [Candidatus Contendobacter sp.]|nr:RICIN domain-containing protein [Candidatus Contendobacter sp.]MDG4559615.1 RICIN domain-containing protein [Candidatus Contendobacter sp.]
MKVCSYYYLMAKHSGKFITITGGGSTVVQHEIYDLINQIWLFIPSNDIEWYFIISKGTGKCLTYTPNGLSMLNIDGNDSQKWRFEDLMDGFFLILNKSHGCLDVCGERKSNNVEVITYRPHRGDNQRWKLLDL